MLKTEINESSNELFRTENLTKSFGATKAVRAVSMSMRAGEIRALIGENGSGKSTISSMIVGLFKPDSGRMFYEGREYAPATLIEAAKVGICYLRQESGAFQGLTVAENIYLGKEGQFAKRGTIKRKNLNAAAAKALEEIGLQDLSPKAYLKDLTFEQRKLVELVNVIQNQPKLLIIDESTTALTQYGRRLVYQIMKDLKRKGGSVIFISHDMDEVVENCDSVTVLRDGQFIKTVEKEDMNIDYLRTLMIGRELSDHYYRIDTEPSYKDEVVLSVRNVETETLHGVSIDLHRGEILGIGGLTDCGMHDLGKVIFGAVPTISGEVVTDGHTVSSIGSALKHSVAYLPKDRDHESLFLTASVSENISVVNFDSLKKGTLISKKKEAELAEAFIKELSIKTQGGSQSVRELSGGNKQKVAIAKWLARDPDVLIMDCPTRGIDVGVKEAIYHLMEELKAKGKAVIMISEELPELIGMSDRVLILKDGRISGTFDRSDDLSESTLINYMI